MWHMWITSKERFDIVPSFSRHCDVLFVIVCIWTIPSLFRSTHHTKCLLVGLTTDKEFDSTQDSTHVKNLKISMTDAKDYLYLVAHGFSNFSLAIESTLSSFPWYFLDELFFFLRFIIRCSLVALWYKRFIETGPNCDKWVSHKLDQVTSILLKTSGDNF